MIFWRHEISTLTRTEIEDAVDNDAWQRFRLSLKGLSTQGKLDHLDGYLGRRIASGTLERVHKVRVDNYINALLRGGQLYRDSSGNIRA